MNMETTEYSIDVQTSPADALSWLEEGTHVWGGDFRRVEANEETDGDAKLVLPVQAGLRHGALLATATATALGDGSRTRIALCVDRSDYRVPIARLLVLFAGLAGAVLIVVMPLVPHLVALLPLAFAFLILAWFLVLARVKYRGMAEFVALLEEARDASD